MKCMMNNMAATNDAVANSASTVGDGTGGFGRSMRDFFNNVLNDEQKARMGGVIPTVLVTAAPPESNPYHRMIDMDAV